jgi:hypothetical protein
VSVVVESDLPRKLLERWLQSDAELQRFVEQFLSLRLPMAEWTHRAHVGVAATLTAGRGRDAALATLRDAIPRYNEATGGANTDSGGYHETLTVFWVDRVADLLDRLPQEWGVLARVRAVVEAYGSIRRLDRAYYSFDVVKSSDARRQWIPPDSKG